MLNNNIFSPCPLILNYYFFKTRLDTINQYLIILEKDDHIFLHSKDSSFFTAKGNRNTLDRRLYSQLLRYSKNRWVM